MNGRLMTDSRVLETGGVERVLNAAPDITDLRDRMTALADLAWQQDRGVWALDGSLAGSRVRNASDLETLAIWPKLYRRLFSFFKDGNSSLSDFDGWLRADPDERDDEIWIIPQAHRGNMHDVVEVSGGSIRMLYWPEELIVVPG